MSRESFASRPILERAVAYAWSLSLLSGELQCSGAEAKDLLRQAGMYEAWKDARERVGHSQEAFRKYHLRKKP